MTSVSTSKPAPTRNAEIKRRLKALKSLPISEETCEVPGCKAGKITDACCYRHSLDAYNAALTGLPNDGIIDWVAIDIAVQDARPVRLTRVEKNIAIAKMLLSGVSPTEVADRMGVSHGALSSGPRAEEIARIMVALANA